MSGPDDIPEIMRNPGEWWETPGIDTRTPSPARMYDYYLGGKDFYEVDREAAERALAALPDGRALVRENRNFLGRVVRYLVAECGIRQILDLGSGLPTARNVHEVARDIAPGTRVVYADNDRIVLAHARALLADGNSGVTVADVDLRDADQILAAAREHLDLTEPVAVLFVAVLHFVADEHDPHATVARVRDELPGGSYLALSHVEDRPEITTAAMAYSESTTGAVTRSRSEIARFFTGFELAEPGLVETHEWRPEGGEFTGQGILAGAGKLPQRE